MCVYMWMNEWMMKWNAFHQQYKKGRYVSINIPAIFKKNSRIRSNTPPRVIRIRMCCSFVFLSLFSHDFQQSAIKAKGIEPGESIARLSSRWIYNVQLFLEGLSLPPSVNIHFLLGKESCLRNECIWTVRERVMLYVVLYDPSCPLCESHTVNRWTKGSVLQSFLLGYLVSVHLLDRFRFLRG